jgi:hypothetical protein
VAARKILGGFLRSTAGPEKLTTVDGVVSTGFAPTQRPRACASNCRNYLCTTKADCHSGATSTGTPKADK